MMENDGLLQGLFRHVNHEFPQIIGIRGIFCKAFHRYDKPRIVLLEAFWLKYIFRSSQKKLNDLQRFGI